MYYFSSYNDSKQKWTIQRDTDHKYVFLKKVLSQAYFKIYVEHIPQFDRPTSKCVFNQT